MYFKISLPGIEIKLVVGSGTLFMFFVQFSQQTTTTKKYIKAITNSETCNLKGIFFVTSVNMHVHLFEEHVGRTENPLDLFHLFP